MIPLLVPRRPDGGPRDLLWAFARPWWQNQGFQPHEGAQPDAGPFNRGAAINAAARAAARAGDWDAVVIADADVVLDRASQAEEARDRAVATGRLTYAHDHLTMLDTEATDLVLQGDPPSFVVGGLTRHPNTWSQCLAVPRRLWEAVGGFDERFVGWGWDDLAFMSACWALGGGIERVRGDAYHLWHPRTWEENEGNPGHGPNQVLGQRYLAAKTDRRAMQAILAERADG